MASREYSRSKSSFIQDSIISFWKACHFSYKRLHWHGKPTFAFVVTQSKGWHDSSAQWIVLSFSCASKKREKSVHVSKPNSNYLCLKNIAPRIATFSASRGVAELRDRLVTPNTTKTREKGSITHCVRTLFSTWNFYQKVNWRLLLPEAKLILKICMLNPCKCSAPYLDPSNGCTVETRQLT